VIRGEPSPPGLMKWLAEQKAEGTDLWADGWYHVAREAAAADEDERAFDALRRACSYWCNPPLYRLKEWEKDTRWGPLRDDPRFQRILNDRRRAIGPIHGSLMYLPEW